MLPAVDTIPSRSKARCHTATCSLLGYRVPLALLVAHVLDPAATLTPARMLELPICRARC